MSATLGATQLPLRTFPGEVVTLEAPIVLPKSDFSVQPVAGPVDTWLSVPANLAACRPDLIAKYASDPRAADYTVVIDQLLPMVRKAWNDISADYANSCPSQHLQAFTATLSDKFASSLSKQGKDEINAHNNGPLATVLDSLAVAYGRSPSDPAKFQQMRENILNHFSGEIVGSIVSSAIPGNTLATQHILKFAHDRIEIEFVKTLAGTEVEIRNLTSGVKATISADVTLSPEEKICYETLVTRLGSEQRRETVVQEALLAHETIPDLRKCQSKQDILDAYLLLAKYSGENVTFSTHGNPSNPSRVLVGLVRGLPPGLALDSSNGHNHQKPLPFVATLENEFRDLNLNTAEGQPLKIEDKLTYERQKDFLTDSIWINLTRDVPFSKGAIQSLSVRQELGKFYVDIDTKDFGGGGTTLSICVNDTLAQDPQKLKDALLDLLRTFEGDRTTDLKDSSTFRNALLLGKISAIEGEGRKGKPAILSGLDWLGNSLAPNAEIKNITFRDSALDFSGVNTKITNCTFIRCLVQMNLVDAEIKESSFDKKTVLAGTLTGKLSETSIRGNALYLDMRRVTFEVKGTHATNDKGVPNYKRIGSLMSGGIFNANAIPRELGQFATKSLSGTWSGRRAEKALEKVINGDLFLAAFHQYSLEHLGGIKPFAKLSEAQRADSGDNRFISTSREQVEKTVGYKKVKAEIIDIFPAGTDISQAHNIDDLYVMRVYVDDKRRMSFMYGRVADLRPTFEEAQADGLTCAKGNALTYRAAMDFVHLDFDAKKLRELQAARSQAKQAKGP